MTTGNAWLYAPFEPTPLIENFLCAMTVAAVIAQVR